LQNARVCVRGTSWRLNLHGFSVWNQRVNALIEASVFWKNVELFVWIRGYGVRGGTHLGIGVMGGRRLRAQT